MLILANTFNAICQSNKLPVSGDLGRLDYFVLIEYNEQFWNITLDLDLEFKLINGAQRIGLISSQEKKYAGMGGDENAGDLREKRQHLYRQFLVCFFF